MKRFVAAVTLACVSSPLFAAPPTVAQKKLIEQAVKEQLKDPDSAKFKHSDYHVDKTDGVYCGYVNAKNSYGGYTGFQTFEVLSVADGKGFIMIGVDGDGVMDKICHYKGAL
jgi:hypothetical protein